MKNQYRVNCLLLLLLLCSRAFAQSSFAPVLFNSDWKFHKGDVPNGEKADLNTGDWRDVSLPHDWSIEGPFSSEWASATGFLPSGIGWYQKTFTTQADWNKKNLYIYFDGVYKNSTVWLNGHLLGNRPNGFIPFEYELSKYLNTKGENVLTVKVDHSQFADSRWYTGSGIYRNVYLIAKEPLHIRKWGVEFTTSAVSATSAHARVKIRIQNSNPAPTITSTTPRVSISDGTPTKVLGTPTTGRGTASAAHATAYALQASIEAKLLDANGKVVASATKPVQVTDSAQTELSFTLESPQLWSVDQPNLYKLQVSVLNKGKITDQWTENVGIRDIRFDADQGFFLNGKNMKLKGVCIHDDAGALGVAVPEGVWRRRLAELKEVGCNSLRLSHNPHADYLYRLCDEMGFLVMDEAFDEWEYGKNKWVQGWNVGTPSKDGYSQYFNDWSSRDVSDMVLRNYNHPSIFMWSIGNEIDYPNDPYSSEVLNTGRNPQIYGRGYLADHPPVSRLSEISKRLVKVVKDLDTSRPVTAALAGVVMSNTTSYPENLDVVGYNYQEYRYTDDHKEHPKRIIYGSENGMQLSYWNAVDSNAYISGQYLWTGIDYLGEAGRWPERSNGAGLLDLAGFRKPEFFFRQSLWSHKPMIYIGTTTVPKTEDKGIWSHKRADHNWNWKTGDKVRVNCFTNCSEAELFLNGKSLGRKSQDNTRVIYWDIDYVPGELSAKGYNQQQQAASDQIKTAGPAYAIRANIENELSKTRAGLYQVVVQLVDQAGNPVYNSENEITVSIDGKATLLGLESGSALSHEDYKSNKRKVLNGKLLAYIQLPIKGSNVKVTFKAAGLNNKTINLD
jgi:beta-galactosidase